jgi:hypothetical protein
VVAVRVEKARPLIVDVVAAPVVVQAAVKMVAAAQ